MIAAITTHNSLPRIRVVTLTCAFLSFHAYPQSAPSPQRFPDLFTFEVINDQGASYINTGPDSLPSDPSLHARCTALWPYHFYLYSIFSNTYGHEEELQAMLPDTVALAARFDSLLQAETRFKDLYLRSLTDQRIASLHIDSAIRIAAHFYYLHLYDGEPTLHLCVGINKVRELSNTADHPHHAAFCYLTIWEMEDSFAPFDQVKTPFAEELKGQPTKQRVAEIEQELYKRIAALPEVRQALIATYERKAPYLNFELLP